jgi:hypothetical protein
MAQGTDLVLGGEREDAPEVEDRWPPLYSVLFVAATSLVLWTVLIGAARWLLAQVWM